MSEYFGAKNMTALRRTLSVALRTGLMASLAVAGAGFLLSPLIIRLLAVPADISGITNIYLRITFLGAPFTFAYNALAAAMKSVGDSKTPLRFLAFCAILNAVLDLILLGVFHRGIITSAVTTVVAEGASAVLALRYLIKKTPQLLPRGKEWRHDSLIFSRVVRYGVPTAMQQAIQPIGKVLIQGQVNMLGVSAIAAFHAVTRADDFACIPAQGISSAISTFIAQNRGARREDRIRRGFFTGLGMAAVYGILIAGFTFLLRRPIVSLFVTGEAAADVIALGSSYLGVMAFLYMMPGMTNGFQGYFRGMGRMRMTILGTTIQISIRTLCTCLLAPRIGLPGIAVATGIGWGVMLLVEVPIALRSLRTSQNMSP